jgi:hypothetical protein
MNTPTCPACQRVIPADDINVSRDVAFCRACNLSHALSDLTHADEELARVDLNRPPSGTWHRNTAIGRAVGASHFSLKNAAGLLFITLFWNGIVSVFVTLAIAAALKNLNIPAPEWFPNPKMNGKEMGAGPTIFLWLFLTPFLTIGFFLAASLLSTLFGRTEVEVSGGIAAIRVGIGPLSWTRRVDLTQMRALRLHQSVNRNGAHTEVILAETNAGKEIKFGSLLPDVRRRYLIAALKQLLRR